MSYKIVRSYLNSNSSLVIMRGLDFEDARAYCRDPETSSSTCTTADKKAVTRRNGPWFDGYEEE